jgi:hypothetical protein
MLSFCLLSAVYTAQVSGMSQAAEPDLINLKTPHTLKASEQSASVELRYEGGYEKTVRGDLGYSYGVTDHFEVDGTASLSKWNTETTPGGTTVRSGGTDEELALKYKVDSVIPVSAQVGLSYVHTPAQTDRLAATLGASAEYAPQPGLRFYANPRAVLLDKNSIVGFGLGASLRVVEGIDLIGDWTPILAGQNSIDTQTGTRSRGQLYSVGLRFRKFVPNGTLDVGVTNAVGSTTGDSLTPTVGDSPSLFVRASYRF